VLHFYSGQPLQNLSGVDTANCRNSRLDPLVIFEMGSAPLA
jgi:hypothetical protein